MKKFIQYPKSRIHRIADREGKSLEQDLQEMVAGNAPIQGGARLEYTERGDGVLPQYDIRTDRFELALKATSKVNKTKYAQRMKEDGYTQAENGQWIKQQPEPKGEA